MACGSRPQSGGGLTDDPGTDQIATEKKRASVEMAFTSGVTVRRIIDQMYIGNVVSVPATKDVRRIRRRNGEGEDGGRDQRRHDSGRVTRRNVATARRDARGFSSDGSNSEARAHRHHEDRNGPGDMGDDDRHGGKLDACLREEREQRYADEETGRAIGVRQTASMMPRPSDSSRTRRAPPPRRAAASRSR